MARNIIFYFTGTGNSLKVAKDIAKIIGDCDVISMPFAYASKGDYQFSADVERIGFVYPVYGGPPNFVKKFVSEFPFPEINNIYYFAVVTCGHFKWDSIALLKDRLSVRGIALNAGFVVKMVANAISLYRISKKAENILRKSQVTIDSIAEKIKEKEVNEIRKTDPLKKFHESFSKSMPSMDKNFIVSDSCIGCTICAKVCPVKNIEFNSVKPEFKHNCEQCLACLHHCSQKAINYGHITQNRKRYINPCVTVSEIIKGN